MIRYEIKYKYKNETRVKTIEEFELALKIRDEIIGERDLTLISFTEKGRV